MTTTVIYKGRKWLIDYKLEQISDADSPWIIEPFNELPDYITEQIFISL